MTFYFVMVNAWSLAASILGGTFEEDYPVMNKKEIDEKTGLWKEPDPVFLDDDGLDYESDYMSSSADYMSDIDDQYAHYYTPYQMADRMDYEPKHAHYYKYHEEEILKDIEEYVSGTYQGHYTGNSHEFRKVQTIDLMASKDLASGFCQANILKYGSRYGNKDGRNKKDLLKVIHYAMLLLHFDEHYNKPPMTTGNIDINMP